MSLKNLELLCIMWHTDFFKFDNENSSWDNTLKLFIEEIKKHTIKQTLYVNGKCVNIGDKINIKYPSSWVTKELLNSVTWTKNDHIFMIDEEIYGIENNYFGKNYFVLPPIEFEIISKNITNSGTFYNIKCKKIFPMT